MAASSTGPTRTDAQPASTLPGSAPNDSSGSTPLTKYTWLTFVNACCISEGYTRDKPIDVAITFTHVASTALKIGKMSSSSGAIDYAATALNKAGWTTDIIAEVAKTVDVAQLEVLVGPVSNDNIAKFDKILTGLLEKEVGLPEDDTLRGAPVAHQPTSAHGKVDAPSTPALRVKEEPSSGEIPASVHSDTMPLQATSDPVGAAATSTHSAGSGGLELPGSPVSPVSAIQITANGITPNSSWPPVAQEGLVVKCLEQQLGELEHDTPSHLLWVPGPEQGSYKCVKCTASQPEPAIFPGVFPMPPPPLSPSSMPPAHKPEGGARDVENSHTPSEAWFCAICAGKRGRGNAVISTRTPANSNDGATARGAAGSGTEWLFYRKHEVKKCAIYKLHALGVAPKANSRSPPPRSYHAAASLTLLPVLDVRRGNMGE